MNATMPETEALIKELDPKKTEIINYEAFLNTCIIA